MKFNSPIPQTLPKECEKASKIFRSFVSRSSGLDNIIPLHVLERAKGFAIFSVFKAGFVFSARAGSGVVIARLPDGSWSAPSAIGTAGLGVGGQLGAEVTDFLIILNSSAAVRSFMAAGSLTLGGNMSIAIGPLGRNGEATGAVNSSGKVAAMYSYSKTRGLFGGVSVEGSVIVERQDANAIAYGSDVTVRQLLGGQVDVPGWAEGLHKALETCTGLPSGRKWIQDEDGGNSSPGNSSPGYAFGKGVSSPNGSQPSTPGLSYLKKKRPTHSPKPSFPPPSWDEPADSYFSSTAPPPITTTNGFDTHFDSTFTSASAVPSSLQRSFSSASKKNSDYSSPSTTRANDRLIDFDEPSSNNYPSSDPFNISSRTMESPLYPKKRAINLARPLGPGEIARVVALYDFVAVESGDLPFSKGDVITVTKRTESTDDWWEGKLSGRNGSCKRSYFV
ncbi:hypothetical protein DL96DRAFT_1666466 [Flagelloscypha sp. PMI_526]|nr:hypothetical protein DL96DRAFT_1666466 [Flagelloscypha sp. PMI_526]